jgi:hypothetical protein
MEENRTMTLTLTQSRACRECGTGPLTDPVSLMYRVGSGCRREMTGKQLAAALKLTRAESEPGYIPPDRAPSVDALLTNRQARAVAAQAEAPIVCAAHGGLLGQCPLCKHEALNPAARIIRLVKADGQAARRADRITVLTRRYGGHPA